ncbi:hypothetical protein DFJ73DRAFT_114712 [Zopfochytrium polystomum]|nr:hypothetical protein DFJ73DRAFT_114712 [Zopfochytrium polystomum]
MTASSGSTRPPKTSNKLEKSGDSEAATTGSNESEDGMSAGPQESNSSSSGKKNGFSSQAPPAGAGGKAHPLPSRPKVTVGASTVEKPAESTSRAVPDVGETPRSVPSSDETGAPAASAAKSLDHPSDSPVRSTTPPASSNYKGRPSSVNGHYNGRRSNGQLGGGFNRGGPNNQYQQHPHHHHHQQHPNVGPAAGMVPFHPYAAAPAPNGFAPIGPPALMTVGGSYPGRAAAQHYLVGGGSGGGGTNFPVHRGKGFNRGISIPEILLPPGSTDPVLVSSVDYATCVEWIRQQIEYYFSIENLCRDLYFRGQMNPRNGAVALRVIAGFNRIRTLTAVARAKSDELNKVKKDSKKEPSPEKTPALSDQQSALEPDGSGSPLASATTEPPSKARGLEWALELIVGCLRSSNVVEVIELSLDPSNPEPVSESTPKPAVPNTERGLRLRSNWESWVLYTTPSVGPVFVPPPPQFVNPNPNTAAQYAIGPSGPAGPAAGMNGYSLYMQPIAQLLPGQAVPAAAYMPGHSHPHPSPYHAHPISPAQQQPHHQHHPQQQQQQPPAPSLFGGNPYMNGMGMMPVPRGSGGGGGGGNGRRRHNSNHYGGAGGGGSSSGPQLHSQGEAAGSRKASSTENQQQQYQLSQNTAGESLESDAPSSGPDLKSTAVAN